MRMRARLLLAFVAVHCVLSLCGGFIAWQVLEQQLATQARSSAQRLGELIAHGGFAFHEHRQRLSNSLAMSLRFMTKRQPCSQVRCKFAFPQQAFVVVINYHNESYRRHRRWSGRAVLAFFAIGTVFFAAVSWWLAGRMSRPLEQLAKQAQGIAQDEEHDRLDQPISQGGGGEIAALAIDLEAMRQRLRQLMVAQRQQERLSNFGYLYRNYCP